MLYLDEVSQEAERSPNLVLTAATDANQLKGSQQK